jgi:cell division protein FtsI/penicillin-binding protein 2
MIRIRLRLLALALSLPFAAVLGQLVWMQLVEENHREYEGLAERRRAVYPLPRRGRILARDGSVLAANRTVFDLHFKYFKLNPRERALRRLVVLFKSRGFSFEREAIEQSLLSTARGRGLLSPGSLEGPLPDESTWLALFRHLNAETAASIQRSLGDHEAVFQLVPASDGDGIDLLFDADALLGYERTLAWVSKLLLELRPDRPAPLAGDLDAVVTKVLENIARRAAGEAKALERSGAKEKDVLAKRRHARDALLANPWLLERDVPASVVTELEYYPTRYPGIVVKERTERFYPEAEVFGTVTGRVQALRDPEALAEKGELLERLEGVPTPAEFEALRGSIHSRRVAEGVFGLERYYDDELRGLLGQRILRSDPLTRAGQASDGLAPEHGKDLTTTLDLELQRLLYAELGRRVRPLGRDAPGVAASAVVLDIETGALLAHVGFPGIDPNRIHEEGYAYVPEADRGKPKEEREPTEFERLGVPGLLLDRPSLHPLFPGSVFKIIVAAAALEEGHAWEGDYTPTRRYPCQHVFALSKKLRCGSEFGHTSTRDVDLAEALQFSCNNYFYYLGLKHLEAADLHRWAKAFGFENRTGLDLHAEPLVYERGFLSAPENVPEFGKCHFAIGQVHVRATPLQVARMVAAIGADEPRLPIPYLVEPPTEPAPRVPISTATVALIREGLWRAAHHPHGTAAHERLGLRDFSVALKTGTAELDRKGKRVNLGWLTGYAPAAEPSSPHPIAARIAFAVVVEETSAHGGDACAPVVRKMMEYFVANAPTVYDPGATEIDGAAQ